MRGGRITAPEDLRDVGKEAADRQRHYTRQAAELEARKEARRRRRSLEAMAWVALLALIVIGAFAAAQRDPASERTCIAVAGVVIVLAALVRLLVLAFHRGAS